MYTSEKKAHTISCGFDEKSALQNVCKALFCGLSAKKALAKFLIIV